MLTEENLRAYLKRAKHRIGGGGERAGKGNKFNGKKKGGPSRGNEQTQKESYSPPQKKHP